MKVDSINSNLGSSNYLKCFICNCQQKGHFLVLDAASGYELYKDKGCQERDEIDAGRKVNNREECADICNNRLDCVSFEYWGGKNPKKPEGVGYCRVSSTCTANFATNIPDSWLYVKIGYSSETNGGNVIFSVK